MNPSIDRRSALWLLVLGAPLLAACGGGSGSGGAGGSGGTGGSAGAGVPSDDPAQLCVDTINMYRATLSLTPYKRWSAEESCADDQALSDSKSGSAHGAFNMCGEQAQNECPGWPGPPKSMITGCLQMMWGEGPGADFSTHGHYINMSSTTYTKVSCGFNTLTDGSVWATQDFQ
jgi:hypothetical protein